MVFYFYLTISFRFISKTQDWCYCCPGNSLKYWRDQAREFWSGTTRSPQTMLPLGPATTVRAGMTPTPHRMVMTSCCRWVGHLWHRVIDEADTMLQVSRWCWCSITCN